MKKKELLIPAGSMEALKRAVHEGADAIYLAGKQFGARAYAPNFTLEELKEAIQYCHLYDVLVYVTVNTMIYERELPHVLKYIEELYNAHVDAVIVADLGLISMIHRHFPKLEIHASTQLHTFHQDQIQFLKELGVKRVVVDRELSIDEIESLTKWIEIEVFIHGALCVSYSGQCLMSALSKGRSGNRGCCAQLCRLPYQVYEKDKKRTDVDPYVLSTKELNTSYHIQELITSKVTSFKVEGRMKSPEYVGFITRYYRTLMDSCLKKEEPKVDPFEEKKLKVLFHREFTSGYLFQEEHIMNMKSPNHQGIPIGKVVEVTPKKIKILLTEPLHQEDGIRFKESQKGMIVNFLYNKSGKLIREANPTELVWIDNKVGLTKCDTVHKTLDKCLSNELQNYTMKKIPIQMKGTVCIPTFTLILSDGKNEVQESMDICETVQKRATTKEEILKHLKKMGSTPFQVDSISIHLEEDVFIPVSKINELRRRCVEKLIQERLR